MQMYHAWVRPLAVFFCVCEMPFDVTTEVKLIHSGMVQADFVTVHL